MAVGNAMGRLTSGTNFIAKIFGFWFVIAPFTIGILPAAIAQDNASLEGKWLVKSSTESDSKTGKVLTIRREGDAYKCSYYPPADAGAEGARCEASTFYGSPTQIMTSSTPSYECLLYIFSNSEITDVVRSVLHQLAGKYTSRNRITLSPDGRFAEHEQDNVDIKFDSSGRLVSYSIDPWYFQEHLERITLEDPVPALSIAAVAQVESRGEFYVLTVDGRKLQGSDADKLPLDEGTRVVTGNDGYLRATLPDNTTFTVGPNSDLIIDKFVYDPGSNSRTILASLSKGLFRWVTGKTPQQGPAQMKVTLPVGTVGIRGTDFEANVQPDGSGSVVLYFGQLEITEKKSGFTFLLNAGEKVTFGIDGSISRPTRD